MANFSEKKWVVIVFLLAAFAGGVPGVIQIWDYFFKKPEFLFLFSDAGAVVGSANNNEKTNLLLIGVFLNNGEIDLYPNSISLEFKHRGQVVVGEPRLVKDLVDKGSFKEFKFTDSIVDLQLTKQLIVKQPIFGCIDFMIPIPKNEMREIFKEVDLFLVIKDIYGEKYKTKVDIRGDYGPAPSKQLFPRSGISVN